MWDWMWDCDKTYFTDKHRKHIGIELKNQALNVQIWLICALNAHMN